MLSIRLSKGYYTFRKLFCDSNPFLQTRRGSLKGVDTGLAEQIDILPTILSYLNYPYPYVAFGTNLFDKNSRRFVINYIQDSYQFLSGRLCFLPHRR